MKETIKDSNEFDLSEKRGNWLTSWKNGCRECDCMSQSICKGKVK